MRKVPAVAVMPVPCCANALLQVVVSRHASPHSTPLWHQVAPPSKLARTSTS